MAVAVGNASVFKLDPAGGASYVAIAEQLDGSLEFTRDMVEATTKDSGQKKVFKYGNFALSASLNGLIGSDPALDLDGATEYAHVADHADLDLTTAITLEAIVTPDSVTGTQYLIHKTDGLDGYYLALSGDEVAFLVDNSAATDSTTTTDAANLAIGTQYHIKAVYNGGTTTTTIWVNGVSKAVSVAGTVPAAAGVNATRMTIGADAAGANLFDGKMFRAAIDNASTDNGQYLIPSACQAFYAFDDGAVNPTDSSGNSHTLTGVAIAAADYGDLTHYTLRNGIVAGSSVVIQLLETGTALTYTATFLVSGVSMSYPQNDTQKYTINLQGTGSVTIA